MGLARKGIEALQGPTASYKEFKKLRKLVRKKVNNSTEHIPEINNADISIEVCMARDIKWDHTHTSYFFNKKSIRFNFIFVFKRRKRNYSEMEGIAPFRQIFPQHKRYYFLTDPL